MKSCRPVAGAASKSLKKVSVLQRQVAREHERHNNKVGSIAAQRDALRGVAVPALWAMKMVKLQFDEIEEHQRHKTKMVELQRRMREA
jgi:hypothetical protein